jgi:peptidoglycan hydrolase-like protein with peptidoglycan-binding domain
MSTACGVPGTESAVRSYQQQHNLNATGRLDADTLASLNLGPNQNYGNAQPQPNDQRYGSNNQPNASNVR